MLTSGKTPSQMNSLLIYKERQLVEIKVSGYLDHSHQRRQMPLERLIAKEVMGRGTTDMEVEEEGGDVVSRNES